MCGFGARITGGIIRIRLPAIAQGSSPEMDVHIEVAAGAIWEKGADRDSAMEHGKAIESMPSHVASAFQPSRSHGHERQAIDHRDAPPVPEIP